MCFHGIDFSVHICCITNLNLISIIIHFLLTFIIHFLSVFIMVNSVWVVLGFKTERPSLSEEALLDSREELTRLYPLWCHDADRLARHIYSDAVLGVCEAPGCGSLPTPPPVLLRGGLQDVPLRGHQVGGAACRTYVFLLQSFHSNLADELLLSLVLNYHWPIHRLVMPFIQFRLHMVDGRQAPTLPGWWGSRVLLICQFSLSFKV